jgi:hypothetical protein
MGCAGRVRHLRHRAAVLTHERGEGELMSRTVCHFSCGAASAVATKLALGEFDHAQFEIVNVFLAEEHPDNRRFLDDCSHWFGKLITVLRDTKYGASAQEVWRRERYTKGRYGAPCSRNLKRIILDAFSLPDDLHILGFTVEESERMDRFIDANNGVKARALLIERGLTKNDCLAMVQRAGIELPMMYRLGYENANCIGCVKGGQGYWNKIRRDFPDQFLAVAKIEHDIGPSAYLFRDRNTGKRFSLLELDPTTGRHDEPAPSCSFFCELAEEDL